MKKISAAFIVALLFFALVITPTMAKSSSSNSNGKSSNGTVNTINDTSTVNSKSSKSTFKKYSNAQEKQNLRNSLQKRMATSSKKKFNDTNNHWADKYISLIQQMGLVNGYEDGSFKPDDNVSSVEAVAMVINLTDAVEGTDTNSEPDAAEVGTEPSVVIEETTDTDSTDTPEWAKNYTKKAAALNIINLNRFHSEVQASRAQVAVMFAKAMNLEPLDTQSVNFNDGVLINSEDVGYILALKEAGIIKGGPDGNFNPNSSITRAEMATIVARIVETTSGIEVTDTTTPDTTTPDTSTPDTSTSDTTNGSTN